MSGNPNTSTSGQLHRPQCKMQAAYRSSYYTIKVNQLEKDKEELQAKVQELSKMNNLLQQQLTGKTEITELFAENEALKKKVNKLRGENNLLKQNNAQLKVGANNLRISHKKLEDENKGLRASHKRLQNTNDDLMKLRDENEKLNQEILQLCKQREILQNSSDRNPETLRSVTETEDLAVKTVIVQPNVVQNVVVQAVAVQKDALQPNAVQTDAVQPDAVQTYAVQPDAVQTDAVQPDTVQTDVVQTVAVKEIAVQTDAIQTDPVIPQELQINKLEKEKSLLISRLTELEEQSFKFTNAFTTAGEGSVMKLRDTYRSLQTNGRPAANRAHKKTYKGIPYPIAEHTMLAYEEAKALALKEFGAVSEKFHSLFQLKPSTDSNTSQEKENKAIRQSQQLLESFHAKPLNEKVYQILIEKYKALTNQAPDGIPKPIEDYYSELAKFTWDCVARTIPMIMSTEIGIFASDVHETKDGDDEDDDDSNKGKFVSYVYPVLFTSNSWPREIAMKGRVNILPSQDTIV